MGEPVEPETLEEVVLEALADCGGLVNLERSKKARRWVTGVVLGAIDRAGWQVVRLGPVPSCERCQRPLQNRGPALWACPECRISYGIPWTYPTAADPGAVAGEPESEETT